MATTITELTALRAAAAMLANTDCDAEIVEKLVHMADMREARASKPRTATREQRENHALMRKVAAAMASTGEVYYTGDIMNLDGRIASPQKATALMRKAVDEGLVIKQRDGMGKVQYRAVQPID